MLDPSKMWAQSQIIKLEKPRAGPLGEEPQVPLRVRRAMAQKDVGSTISRDFRLCYKRRLLLAVVIAVLATRR